MAFDKSTNTNDSAKTEDIDPHAVDPSTKFTDAVAELDVILAELESDRVDVDVLGDRVERAAALVKFCRERLESSRARVRDIQI